MKKDTVTSIINGLKDKDFEPFRNYYEFLSFEELKYINNEACKIFSNQAQADYNINIFYNILIIIINLIGRPLRVVELGSNRGYLAKEVLGGNFSEAIESWIGYDLSNYAVETSIVSDRRYEPIELQDYFFNTKIPKFDLFVCTHTFEHMNKTEVIKCINHVKECTFAIIEVPRVDMMETSWKGYCGTHVLKMTVEELTEAFTENGLKLFYGQFYSVNWWAAGWGKIEVQGGNTVN